MKNVCDDGVRITNTYTGEVLEKGKDYMADMVAGTISINRPGTFDISASIDCPEYRSVWLTGSRRGTVEEYRR